MSDLQEHPGPADGRLGSWKEIAFHLDRDVRTVQRWEKTEGLPVHRHQHDRQGSVYAFRGELDAWREARQAPAGEPVAPPAGAAEREEPLLRPAPAPRSLGGRLRILGLAAVLAAASGLLLVRFGRPARGPASVAVLPFANLSGDASQDYFSDGITEELITQLGRLQRSDAHIVALGSALSYKRTQKPLRQIAGELGVAYVMEGTVRRAGDRVRISVHLVRGRDETHVWDQSYDCDVVDSLALQSEVAGSITTALAERIGQAPARSIGRPRPEALEAYLRGRFFWNKRTPADLQKALACFQQATALDGGYAPAFVGLADCYALLGSAEMGALAPNEAMPRAREAVLKALALDPGLAEAHATLAHLKLVYDWDWPGAEQSFRRAILLNPDCVTAHQWFALYYNALGRAGQALAEVRKAEQLDPLSPIVKTALAETCYFARRYPEAEAAARAALELDPGFLLGWVNLGRALEQQGRFREAAAGLEPVWLASGRPPGLTMLLGHIYARAGDPARARRMLDELRSPPERQGRPPYVPAIYFAALYSGLGDREAALSSLGQAIQERCEYLVYLARDPMADALRRDPGFAPLIRKLGRQG